ASYSSLFSRLRRPTRPTHFPYTTLFRSKPQHPRPPTAPASLIRCREGDHGTRPRRQRVKGNYCVTLPARKARRTVVSLPWVPSRSEEHTSELQSRENLV